MPTADTEIRLIELADAEALATHQTRWHDEIFWERRLQP